ncbi:hypothetical protein [Flavobacterium sp.]|uniref:hypothetical protein n=1 Tax=Flavobacterium sp. TaxID=239 RepID=UPI00260810D2|nr:hypothetical protein [Flavobacterium sp.]
MKNIISFCCSLAFITASMILCVEFKVEWTKVAIGVGWFSNTIYTNVLKYLKNNETN